MRIYIGSDHAGFQLKNDIKTYLEGKYSSDNSFSILDLGVFTTDSADYPDIAREVGEKVRENENEDGGSLGILICGSGVGMSIAANKMSGIRAVLANNEIQARLAKAHNKANVLCLGERLTGKDLAIAIVESFLEGSFDGAERHKRRVDKINDIHKQYGP
ncbi:ribose 5-phosphate isomerase B [Candidatus Peregrinibacteria bacterium]|nr:ribose 5-phosphate isomerase B [Candidatus Peregrinibacteria bacterium]